MRFPLCGRYETAETPALNSEDLSVHVVDDNPTNRRIREELLGSWRIRLLGAGSGLEAVTILQQAHHDGHPFP